MSFTNIFKVVAEIGLKVLIYPHFTPRSNMPVIAICAFHCEGLGRCGCEDRGGGGGANWRGAALI